MNLSNLLTLWDFDLEDQLDDTVFDDKLPKFTAAHIHPCHKIFIAKFLGVKNITELEQPIIMDNVGDVRSLTAKFGLEHCAHIYSRLSIHSWLDSNFIHMDSSKFWLRNFDCIIRFAVKMTPKSKNEVTRSTGFLEKIVYRIHMIMC